MKSIPDWGPCAQPTAREPLRLEWARLGNASDMSNDPTPDPIPVAPEDEPEQVLPSATGLVVPDEGADSDDLDDVAPD